MIEVTKDSRGRWVDNIGHTVVDLNIKIYDPVKDLVTVRHEQAYDENLEEAVNYYVDHFLIDEEEGLAIPPHRILEITWDLPPM